MSGIGCVMRGRVQVSCRWRYMMVTRTYQDGCGLLRPAILIGSFLWPAYLMDRQELATLFLVVYNFSENL